jgi:hypothetical protein
MQIAPFSSPGRAGGSSGPAGVATEDGKKASSMSLGVAHAERATAAIVFALWIAICSAAPELLWQGLARAFAKGAHFEFLSALLFGLISVFFVEPLLYHGRARLEGQAHGEEEPRPWAPLYRFVVGFVFGLAAMFVHEAFNAFLEADGSQPDVGPQAAIVLTVSWAISPFAITLAWQSRRRLWLGIPVGLVAAASSLIAGWLFDWGLDSIVSSTIPALVILGLGYWLLRSTQGRPDFARLAPMVGATALVWIAAAAVFDLVADHYGSNLAKLYDWESVFIDARFYVGWVIGLWLVPRPGRHEAEVHS